MRSPLTAGRLPSIPIWLAEELSAQSREVAFNPSLDLKLPLAKLGRSLPKIFGGLSPADGRPHGADNDRLAVLGKGTGGHRAHPDACAHSGDGQPPHRPCFRKRGPSTFRFRNGSNVPKFFLTSHQRPFVGYPVDVRGRFCQHLVRIHVA